MTYSEILRQLHTIGAGRGMLVNRTLTAVTTRTKVVMITNVKSGNGRKEANVGFGQLPAAGSHEKVAIGKTFLQTVHGAEEGFEMLFVCGLMRRDCNRVGACLQAV